MSQRLPLAMLSPAKCRSRRERAGEQINKAEAAESPSQPQPFLLSHAGLQQVRDGDAARAAGALLQPGIEGRIGASASGAVLGGTASTEFKRGIH